MNFIEIKKKIKSNKFLNTFIRIVLLPFYFLYHCMVCTNGRLRCIFKLSRKYKWILSLKNSHFGERCFIIATGPSLTIEDLDAVKDEYTFSMNSCVKLYDNTKWRPNMYFIQDEYVLSGMEEFVHNANQEMIVPSFLKKYSKYKTKKRYFSLDMGVHRAIKKHLSFKPCKNAFYKVNDGYSVIFACLQFAIYMGFKDIYLLGSDCNYSGSKTHIVETGAIDKSSPDFLYERLIFSHKKMKKFAENNDVNIYNSTRGGMLEVYERKKLEDVISR